MKKIILRGKVVGGDGRGRRLGVTTANLKIFRGRLPLFGVYRVLVDGPGLKGRLGACNIGVNPTIAGVRRARVEVHIPKFSGSLYGETLKLVFVNKIRNELKFSSLKALKAQIRRDVRSLKT